MPNHEFLPVTAAARSLGVSEPTLRHRIREAQITIFADPKDRRRKLVRVADLAQFEVMLAVDQRAEDVHGP